MDIQAKTSVLDRIFFPSTPITSQDFFCGRCSELSFINAAVREPGRHILIYGDRGVGKSSLANMIFHGCKTKVTCRKDSTFFSIWQEALLGIFSPSKVQFTTNQSTSVFEVASIIKKLDLKEKILVVFDEFDVVDDRLVVGEFANAVKFFSDNLPHVCLVFVGIAQNAEELVSFHRSLERCLLRIHLDPMSRNEILDIVDKGLLEISMRCEPSVRELIVRVSAGYPYCVQLLSKYSCLDAIQKRYSVVTQANFLQATHIAILQIYESIRQIYDIATQSSQLYKDIVLCCAIFSKKYFSAEDLLYSIRLYTNLTISSRSCSSYLSKLCQPNRGSILAKSKNGSKVVYSICDPFLKTYLTILAYQKGYLQMDLAHTRE